MQFPRTINRTLNTFTISWNNVYGSDENERDFTLQLCNDFKEWKTIYRGPKSEYKVDRLAPFTCYNLRVKLEDEGWLNFKAATDDPGPYTSVIHMTRAVKLGKTSAIRKIAYLKPILINVENKENKTPLVQAIEAKDLQILQLLITLGANVNKPSPYNRRTPLMFAIYKGELQAAALLIDKGASISKRDINGLTILHHAVDSGELSNVEFTVGTQVDINMQDNNGWTPLIRAAILQCKPSIADYLLEKGADDSIKDKDGFDYRRHLELANTFLNK